MQPMRRILGVFAVRVANANPDGFSLMGTRFYGVVERDNFLSCWCFKPGWLSTRFLPTLVGFWSALDVIFFRLLLWLGHWSGAGLAER